VNAGGTGSSAGNGGNSGGVAGSGNTGNVGGTGNAGGAGGSGAANDGGGLAGSGGLAGAGSIDILAQVADCIDTTNPNPDQCESVMGKYQMVVDLQNSAMIGASGAGGGPPTAVFVRFELGKELSQKTITTLAFDLTITDYTNSGSSSSGEVYTVTPFVRPDLFSKVPDKQALVGANKGTVSTLETVSWSLDPSLAAAQDVLCFGVFPTNIDGAYYYNALGATPPRLHVVYQ